MLRYCVNCKKEYEFSPLAVSGRDDLICPECGGIIDKNSRHPADENADQIEEGLGRAAGGLFHFAYIFYFLLGVIGTVSFFLGIDGLLYTVTFVSMAAFLLQLFTGTLNFTSGLIFLPLGAVLGYLCFGSIKGACLGIHVVFIIRYIVRDIILGLIFRLVQKAGE